MSNDKIARRILKRDLVPAMESAGFKGRFPNFQRREGGRLHLLAVEFDKHGGGFFLELACRPAGDFEAPWGEIVAESDLTVAHTPVEDRARLQQIGQRNSLSEHWFRYENLPEADIEKLVGHVSSLLDQVNDWLREKRVGTNLSASSV